MYSLTSSKVRVTSYLDPDMDGYGGAVAYAEFLQAGDTNAEAVFFGEIHNETKYVIDRFQLPAPIMHSTADRNEQYILVDASDVVGLPSTLKPEQVVEVIDHRAINDAHVFSNAKVQIELVGSACTLVAEKFMQSTKIISRTSALLLYAGIISNTLNFKNTLVTERDHKAAKWLQTQTNIPDNFAIEMFKAKSQYIFNNVSEVMEHDFAWFDFNGVRVGFDQLEMTDTNRLVKENISVILATLDTLKKQHKLAKIFLSLVDLMKDQNIYVTDNASMQEILTSVLGVTFADNVAVRKGLLMRKQTVPLLKKYFESI